MFNVWSEQTVGKWMAILARIRRPPTGSRARTLLNTAQLIKSSRRALRLVRRSTGSANRLTEIQECCLLVDRNGKRLEFGPDRLCELGRMAWLAFCSGPCLKRE